MSQFHKNIFATPLLIGKSDSVQIREKIIGLAYKFKKETKEANLVSDKWNYDTKSDAQEEYNKYGVTSFKSKNLSSDSEWQDVAAFIYDFANTMVKSVYAGPNKVAIQNMWTTIYPNGAYIPEHIHSNALLSGVFYAKAPKDCGDIVFRDPSNVAKTMCVNNIREFPSVDTNWTEPVEEGKMIIFPAWLPHLTLPNKSNEDRIIVSFNIGMQGQE